MSGGELVRVPRRVFVLAAGAGLLAACRRSTESLVCASVAELAKDDTAARARTGYEERTADPGRACVSCQQYVEPPQPGTCGGCKLLRGPIHPQGTCKLYVRRG